MCALVSEKTRFFQIKLTCKKTLLCTNKFINYQVVIHKLRDLDDIRFPICKNTIIIISLSPLLAFFHYTRFKTEKIVRFGTFLYFCGSVSLNGKAIIPESPCENCTAC